MNAMLPLKGRSLTVTFDSDSWGDRFWFRTIFDEMVLEGRKYSTMEGAVKQWEIFCKLNKIKKWRIVDEL